MNSANGTTPAERGDDAGVALGELGELGELRELGELEDHRDPRRHRDPEHLGDLRDPGNLGGHGNHGNFGGHGDLGDPGDPGDPSDPGQDAQQPPEPPAPGTPLHAQHNPSLAFAVDGRLDEARLAEALAVVVRRHEALRAVRRADGARPAGHVVDPDAFRIDVVRIDVPGEPGADDLAAVTDAPFGPDGGPPLRAALFRAPGMDVCCVTARPPAFDEVPASVFLEELVAAYEDGAESPREPLPPVPGPAPAPPSEESLAFWREQLAGTDPDALELSCVAPERDRPAPSAVAHVDRVLPPPTVAALRGLAGELATTETAVLLAAYYALLEAHGAGPDLVVGTPLDVRPEHAARTIGHRTAHVPLRLRVDRRESVGDLVRRSGERLLTAAAHADAAVDAYADLVPVPRSGPRPLPFRHVFAHQTGEEEREFTVDGLTARPYPVTGGDPGRFDLHLRATSADDGIRLRAAFRTELFDRSGAELLLARYEAVLSSFTDDPGRAVGDVPWWSTRDHEIIAAANDTARPVPFASVLDAVHAHALRSPDAVAVVDGDRSVGYGRLWSAAHAMSALIRDAGIGAGDVVATALPRGPELVAAVLGTWLAGAAYLPVDAAHPEERIRYQLSDSGAKLLVADEDSARFAADGLAVLTAPAVDTAPDPEPEPVRTPPAPVDPASRAYLIYTSGSTGRPKGTQIHHGALANVAAHFTEQLGASPGDTMLWTTTFAFDMSGIELHVPLVSGGRLVAAPDAARSDGRVLRELLERYEVRFVEATPTTWRLVIDRVADRLRGRGVIVGGEPVPVPLARRLVAAGCVLHHAYGPTETTIWSTSRVVTEEPAGRLDVGRPIRNTRVHVVDPYDRELPVGVRGELCISGTGVAIGYHGRPELDALRFGEHAEYGRFYRTGDLACWRADGTLALFGRGDRQVKLRGNRIELGEIESVLLAHPGVGAAAVVMVGDPTSDAVLVGCLEPAAGPLDTADVWTYARSRLTRTMLPADLITVAPLPVNASGKVDYPALERMVADRRAEPAPALPSRPEPEELTARLTRLWRDLLRREDVDADTDFFAYGGNSMLAAVAMQELQNMSGVSLGLTEVFERRTPRALAARACAPEGREEAAATDEAAAAG
ncbi:non-ribosomal peptide synthetase [Streptomyces sp. URMC 126]|uniref:non-ribosomal peptide synthetase n=1 Tax=Streptomyces sp. URMC 126 TaxID=3423401 RepID=UPI003F19941F